MSASLCLLCVRDKEMRLKQKNEMKMKIQKKKSFNFTGLRYVAVL